MLFRSKANESEILVYFDKTTMDLKEIMVRANSLDIKNNLVLQAVQPVTPIFFEKDALDFKDVNCTDATPEDQKKLNHYVERIIDIIYNT